SKTEIPLDVITKESVCFRLGDIKNDSAQIVFVEIMLRKLFKFIQNKIRHQAELFVLIDEAQRICKEKATKSFISQIASEVRKYGMGLITVTQMPTLLDKSIIANSATKIVFHISEPEEFEYAIKLLSHSSDWKKREEISKKLIKLKVFQCLLLSTTQKKPCKLRVRKIFNEIPLLKTKEDLNIKILSFIKKKDGICNEKELLDNKKDVDYMIDKKIIEKLSLVDLDGNQRFFIGYSEPRKSLEHNVYVKLLSEKLTQARINHTVLDGAYSPDLEFVHNDQRIAVEYETGKKFYDEDIIKMLKRRNEFDRIIVVVKPEDYKRYSKICKKIKNCEAITTLKFTSLIEKLKNKER
ncbi:MAG: ATP-binding protein, partial [Candidatus Woesearchaeota archaeon]